MAAPFKHAESSAKKFGGTPEDFLEIHKFMDSSKECIADNRHRCLYHHSYGCSVIIPRIFGEYITTSEGRKVSTKDIAEQHVLEDFGMKFIPTLQDYLENVEFQEWMNNGRFGVPNSARKLVEAGQPADKQKD